MKITDYLTPELVFADLPPGEKDEILEALATRVAEVIPKLSRDRVLAVLKEREALGSTGIGGGIAIPHGKMAELDDIVILFARNREGVDFAAVDGRPVQLFFLLLAPESAAGTHLKILARISRMLKNQEFRLKLLEAPGADDLYALIREEDEHADR
ncbi:MAG: PTS sugar transporter subunit IIA [Deltaproteobacteria bacterium]|nr:PTS sugar transporter subunit IIA [Deltaproteobacteria bacterium]